MTPRSIDLGRAMWGVITLLGGLYIAEGIPVGFFGQALPVLMRKQGWSLTQIGLSSLLILPWALKFLWAPLVDRHGSSRFGRRRSWIIPLQITSALLLIALGSLGSGHGLTPLLAVVFLVNLLTATQDIATDALAVDLLDVRSRGISNGVQAAGYRVGMLLGGGVLMIHYERLGFRGTFVAMGLLLLLTLVPALVTREPAPSTSPEDSPSLLFDGNHFLRREGALPILGVIVAYRLGETFAGGMIRPFLTDRGLDMADIGWLLGTVGIACSLAGTLLGGVLVNPLGRKGSLVLFGVLQTVTVIGYAALARGPMSDLAVYLICGAEHLVSGMAATAMYTMMMDSCRPNSNATDFTVQTSALMITTTVASTVCGYSAEKLGYFWHFNLSAGLCAAAVLAVLALYRTPAGAEG